MLKHFSTVGLIFIASIFISLLSCSKDEEIHEDLIITGNTPPQQSGVSELQLNNYTNNLYIDLYGRAPTEAELFETKTILRDGEFTESVRRSIVQELMESYEYYKNINVLTSQKMLVDIDSLTVQTEIDLYVYLLEIADYTGDSVEAFYLQYGLDKLLKLKSAPIDLMNGIITVDEYYRRYIDNYFYDEVNMGSENFVVSCFENLFRRQPTDEEKYSAINMVDGVSTEVFLLFGNTKDDFISICVSVLEFYQGLVLEAYNTLLARSPTSAEMNDYAMQILASGNFNEMKNDIFISAEYAGF